MMQKTYSFRKTRCSATKAQKPANILVRLSRRDLERLNLATRPKASPKDYKVLNASEAFLPSFEQDDSILEIPAFFAAGIATGSEEAAVMRTFACAVRNAKVISSIL